MIDPRTLQPTRQERRRQSEATAGGRAGWFAIGIHRNKHLSNHSSLWRSAWHLGASFLYTVEDRLPRRLRQDVGAEDLHVRQPQLQQQQKQKEQQEQREDEFEKEERQRQNQAASRKLQEDRAPDTSDNADTSQAWTRLPSFRFKDFEALLEVAPEGAALVAVEMGGVPLESFAHPERAIYLLGSEDMGLPASVVARCSHHVTLPTLREASLNVAACGAIVMYDRHLKSQQRQLVGPGHYKKTFSSAFDESDDEGSHHLERNRVRAAKRPAPTGSLSPTSLARWERQRSEGLKRASEYLSAAASRDKEVDCLRSLLDGDPSLRFFVTKAQQPQLEVLRDGQRGEDLMPRLLPRLAEPAAPPTSAAAGAPLEVTLWEVFSKQAGREVAFRPLFLHVRCRDVRSAHWLLKECDGLADASVVSVDAAKVLVRIVGTGRALEVSIPQSLDKVSESSSFSRLLRRCKRSREELRLLCERLRKSLIASPSSDDDRAT